MNKESSGSHVGAVASGCIALLLLLYLFVPIVFAIPLFHAVKRGFLPERVMAVFAPLEMLGEKFPSYEAMIEKEARFCESMGLVPK